MGKSSPAPYMKSASVAVVIFGVTADVHSRQRLGPRTRVRHALGSCLGGSLEEVGASPWKNHEKAMVIVL